MDEIAGAGDVALVVDKAAAEVGVAAMIEEVKGADTLTWITRPVIDTEMTVGYN